MIRFAIKCALGLGLIAMFLPLGQGQDAKQMNLDFFGLAVGVQEAVSDIGGFCSRAPAACDAAREVAVFAGDRIEDGFRIAYAFVGAKLAGTDSPEIKDGPQAALPKVALPAFVETAAEPSLPQPYQPPKRPESKSSQSEISAEDPTPTATKVPTPHPRG